MTDRERWTVYPLLFLALGISLKDKLGRSVETDRVVSKTVACERLEVVGPQPGQQVVVSGGSIYCRALIATDETNKQQLAVVSSNQDGGILRTFGTHTGTHAVLGNFNQYAGLLFVDARGAAHAGPMFGSPVPLKNRQNQGAAAQPAQQPAANQKPAADQKADEQKSAGDQKPPEEKPSEPAQEKAKSTEEDNSAAQAEPQP